MKVTLLSPMGYCAGVVKALETAKKAKREFPDSRIALLGMLVHNEISVKELLSEGFLLIDERKVDLKDGLNSLHKGDVVLFSAHGHPKEYEEIAKEKGLISIDAACQFVKENIVDALIKQKEGRDILYIGSKGHLETTGFLGNVFGAGFYDVKSSSFASIKNLDNPVIYSQTTLSKDEIDKALGEIKKIFPSFTLGRMRCYSTELRQDAIKNLGKEIEAVIVLGSRFSNNSMKLYETSLQYGKKAFLCLDLGEVKELDLSSFHSLALSSGASTSIKTILEVKEYLESL